MSNKIIIYRPPHSDNVSHSAALLPFFGFPFVAGTPRDAPALFALRSGSAVRFLESGSTAGAATAAGIVPPELAPAAITSRLSSAS
jgi:hypothetical protein